MGLGKVDFQQTDSEGGLEDDEDRWGGRGDRGAEGVREAWFGERVEGGLEDDGKDRWGKISWHGLGPSVWLCESGQVVALLLWVGQDALSAIDSRVNQ